MEITQNNPSIFVRVDAAEVFVIEDALKELGLPSDAVPRLAQEIITSINVYAKQALSLTISLDTSHQVVSLELYAPAKKTDLPFLSTAYPVYTFAEQLFKKLTALDLDPKDVSDIMSSLEDRETLSLIDVKLSVEPLDNLATVIIGQSGFTIGQYTLPLLENPYA